MGMERPGGRRETAQEGGNTQNERSNTHRGGPAGEEGAPWGGRRKPRRAAAPEKGGATPTGGARRGKSGWQRGRGCVVGKPDEALAPKQTTAGQARKTQPHQRYRPRRHTGRRERGGARRRIGRSTTSWAGAAGARQGAMALNGHARGRF